MTLLRIGPVLARAASQGLVQGADLVAAIEALAGLGQGQALHDLAATSKLPLEARVAAVKALTPALPTRTAICCSRLPGAARARCARRRSRCS